jgi:gamma-glutamylcyclotransferase (GGCT)/AIG2-like uncharacterized protein YtfP
MTRLFVYGTLMRGGSNSRLLARSAFVGPARTGGGFRLFSLGAFPAMARAKDGDAVVGEVYEIDAPTLADCDRLEGHPRFYRREPIRLDDGSEAIAYLIPLGRLEGARPEIASGDWRAYRDDEHEREEGLA